MVSKNLPSGARLDPCWRAGPKFGMSIVRNVLFVLNSETERTLRTRMQWVAHAADGSDDDDDAADSFERQQLDCFYNHCPIDQVTLGDAQLIIEDDAITDGSKTTFRDLTRDDWERVAYNASYIELVSACAPRAVYVAANKDFFTYRDLLDAVEEHVARDTKIEYELREYRPDHVFFEGLEEVSPAKFQVKFGS